MIRTSLFLVSVFACAACGTASTTSKATEVVSAPTQASDPNAPVTPAQQAVYAATQPTLDANAAPDQNYGWPTNGNITCKLLSSAVDVTWSVQVVDGVKTAEAAFVDHASNETLTGSAHYAYGDAYSDSISGAVSVSALANSDQVVATWVAGVAIETQTLWVSGYTGGSDVGMTLSSTDCTLTD